MDELTRDYTFATMTRALRDHWRDPRKPEQSLRVRNEGYPASLERRKLYVALTDLRASRQKQIRVIDESGEDYLYPEEYFVAVELPEPVRRRVLQAA
jgi:hypothetical protein